MGLRSEEGPTGQADDDREIIFEVDGDDDPSSGQRHPLRGYIEDKEIPLIMLAVGALVVLVLVSPQGSSNDDSTGTALTPSDLTSTTHVIYAVEGSTDQADITYETPTGSEQQTDVDVAFKAAIDLTFPGHPSFLCLSVQNKNDSGEVTCRIVADGKVLSENTARGAYAMARCRT